MLARWPARNPVQHALRSRRCMYIIMCACLLAFAPSASAWRWRHAARCCSLLKKAAVCCGQVLRTVLHGTGCLVQEEKAAEGKSCARTIERWETIVAGIVRKKVRVWQQVHLVEDGPKVRDDSEYVRRLEAARSTVVPYDMAARPVHGALQAEGCRWSLRGSRSVTPVNTGWNWGPGARSQS